MELTPTNTARKVDDSSSSLRAEDDGYIPLKTRLLAWWEGVGVDEINNLKAQAVAIQTSLDPESDPYKWTDHRIAVSQTIWGETFLKPGGAAFAREILNSAKITSKDTVLDLTAGMCGTAMTLARQHNLWMEAYDQDKFLVEKAHNMLVTKGMAQKIKLKYQNLDTLNLEQKKYDLIYSRESLYKVPSKLKIFEEVKRGLKKNGRFIITDFVKTDQPVTEETKNPYFGQNPFTIEQYLNALRANELNVFAHQDISNNYLKHINHAWYDMIKKIEESPHSREFVDTLMSEGSLWLSRHKAIQSGQVRLYRFHCFTSQ